jgi:hypothetical protein
MSEIFTIIKINNQNPNQFGPITNEKHKIIKLVELLASMNIKKSLMGIV